MGDNAVSKGILGSIIRWVGSSRSTWYCKSEVVMLIQQQCWWKSG